MDPLTLYYDGACPLCRREIGLLRRLDRHGRIAFEDVSPPDATPSCPVDRAALLERFHAKLPSGEVVSGARAFTEGYARVPGLAWVRALGRFGPSRAALDWAYARFLHVRPRIQRLVTARSA